MVTPPLVNEAKEDGRRFLEMLDAAGFPVTAVFWMYFPEPDAWRLIVATPRLRKEGPRPVYGPFQDLLEQMDPPPRINLNDIWAAEAREPIVGIMAKEHLTGPGIHGVEIRDRIRPYVTIPAAYIYRTT
jgi:hypothetical protein